MCCCDAGIAMQINAPSDIMLAKISENLPKSLVQTAIRISVSLQGLQASGDSEGRKGRENQ